MCGSNLHAPGRNRENGPKDSKLTPFNAVVWERRALQKRSQTCWRKKFVYDTTSQTTRGTRECWDAKKRECEVLAKGIGGRVRAVYLGDKARDVTYMSQNTSRCEQKTTAARRRKKKKRNPYPKKNRKRERDIQKRREDPEAETKTGDRDGGTRIQATGNRKGRKKQDPLHVNGCACAKQNGKSECASVGVRGKNKRVHGSRWRRGGEKKRVNASVSVSRCQQPRGRS